MVGQVSLLESLMVTFVPRAMRSRRPAFEPFPTFNAAADLLASAKPTVAGAQGPKTRTVQPIASADGRVTTGLWDSQAGVFEVKFGCDEVVHILDGEVHVTSNGAVQTLHPGDVAFFRKGLTTTWDVPRYVRKVWFHRNTKPTIRKRVAYKLRMWSNRVLDSVRYRLTAVSG
jgi:uncharacterized cupin superfamily protein